MPGTRRPAAWPATRGTHPSAQRTNECVAEIGPIGLGCEVRDVCDGDLRTDRRKLRSPAKTEIQVEQRADAAERRGVAANDRLLEAALIPGSAAGHDPSVLAHDHEVPGAQVPGALRAAEIVLRPHRRQLVATQVPGRDTSAMSP